MTFALEPPRQLAGTPQIYAFSTGVEPSVVILGSSLRSGPGMTLEKLVQPDRDQLSRGLRPG
jgi:hypothetical protein